VLHADIFKTLCATFGGIAAAKFVGTLSVEFAKDLHAWLKESLRSTAKSQHRHRHREGYSGIRLRIRSHLAVPNVTAKVTIHILDYNSEQVGNIVLLPEASEELLDTQLRQALGVVVPMVEQLLRDTAASGLQESNDVYIELTHQGDDDPIVTQVRCGGVIDGIRFSVDKSGKPLTIRVLDASLRRAAKRSLASAHKNLLRARAKS